MSSHKYQLSLTQFSQAVIRLEEALVQSKDNTLLVDAVIKRFEFSFELCWKTLKKKCEAEGLHSVASPKAVLKQAYAMQWIDDEAQWLQMLTDRNLSTHTYHQALALEIFGRIKNYLPLFKTLIESLKFSE